MTAIRLTRKARTISARASERKFLETTAKLAKQLGHRVVIAIKGRKS